MSVTQKDSKYLQHLLSHKLYVKISPRFLKSLQFIPKTNDHDTTINKQDSTSQRLAEILLRRTGQAEPRLNETGWYRTGLVRQSSGEQTHVHPFSVFFKKLVLHLCTQGSQSLELKAAESSDVVRCGTVRHGHNKAVFLLQVLSNVSTLSQQKEVECLSTFFFSSVKASKIQVYFIQKVS